MWLLYAVSGAGFKAVTALLQKRISNKIDPWVYAWIIATLTLPMAFVFTIFRDNDPFGTVQQYWLPGILTALTWNLASVFGLMALKREQLSYIIPLAAFTPIFAVATGWIGIGETLPPVGFIGVATVFAGSYIVNIESKNIRWFDPLLRIVNSSGARLAIAAAVLLAINNTITKSTLNDGVSSVDWLFTISVFSWIGLLHIPILRTKQTEESLQKHFSMLLAISVLLMFAGIFAILSVSATATSYALSARRLDILFSILLGWKLLKETNIRNKLTGSILMIIGIAIIATA